MRIWICLLLLVVLPKWAAGQQVNTGVVSGVVLDEEGAPANFAIVRIAELNLVTPCDSLGKYKFENIPIKPTRLSSNYLKGLRKRSL